MVAAWKKSKKDPLLYEKELLPVGEITHWMGDDREVQQVTVERPYLDRLVTMFKQMKKTGVKVPLFKTHKEDPDNERGEIVKLFVKPNEKGEDSLHSHVRFHEKEFARQGRHNDVSVGIPPKFVDGKKNIYNWALRHVALTSKPVVPGLSKFAPIVLSFDNNDGLMLADEPGVGGMNELIAQILAALEITPPEGADEKAMLQLVLQKVQEKPAEGDKAGAAGDMNLSHSPVLVNQMTQGRSATIDGLIIKGVLTPARGAEWKKKFCTPAAIKADLSLSSDDENETISTEFDRDVATAIELSGDRPASPKLPPKTIKMSHDDEEDEANLPPTVRAARRLKKKAEARKRA